MEKNELEVCRRRCEELELVLEQADRLAEAQQSLDGDSSNHLKRRSVSRCARAYRAIRREFSESMPSLPKSKITHPGDVEQLRVTGSG